METPHRTGRSFQFLYYPHNEADYQKAVHLLDDLIDTVGEDEHHPLASLMEILCLLIEKYKDQHVQEISLPYK